MREMKDSGVQWVGLIPNDWNTVSLKYLCSMQSGKTLSSEEISDEGDYPVYGGNGLRGYYTQSNTIGDFLLVGRQGALCGNVHSVQGEFWATEHAIVTKCSSLSDKKFLYYLLLGMNLNQYASNTAAQPGLAVSTIVNIPTCLVPIHEQIEIAEMLDHKCTQVDALITNVQAQIEKLKAYKQSLITEAVTKGLKSTTPMKNSGVEWIGEIPSHWEVHRIANLYAERSESGSPELPLLTVSINTGVSDHEISDKDKDRVFIRMEDRTKYKRVHPGDLTYNMMRAWQGAFGAVRVDGLVSPAYVVAKPKNEIPLDSRYIEALLRTPAAIEEMHRYSRGIVDFRLRLYWPEFKNINICLPPLDEQSKIADYIDGIAAKVNALITIKQSKIEKLEQYKRSLIYEYVTGKKEVS